jgi:hypothetical protein
VVRAVTFSDKVELKPLPPDALHYQIGTEGGQLAGDGSCTRRYQRWLADLVGARAVLPTHSCTAALEMATILFDWMCEDCASGPFTTKFAAARLACLNKTRNRYHFTVESVFRAGY